MLFLSRYRGFTLIEILIGVLITSSILIVGFYSVSAVNIGKIRLIGDINLEKEVFYFQEKLSETIKFGGVIDYEEYFNRKIVGDNLYSSGHYSDFSGFGNGSNSFYYCRSIPGTFMGTGGCVTTHNSLADLSGQNINYTSTRQLYGQYKYMGIDYNSDYDGDTDLGDADGDGTIYGDDDDEFIGNLPEAFSSTGYIGELYLISGDKKKRTFFRWNVWRDVDAPASYSCDTTNLHPGIQSGSGCIGTIEVLKLEGVDWGNDHNAVVIDTTQFDGEIDTWIYDRSYYGLSTSIIANTKEDKYWIPLFSSTVNVKNVSFLLFPSKDPKMSWQDTTQSNNVSPYVRVNIMLTPRYKEGKKITGKIPEFNFSTTINLSSVTNN